MTEHAEAERTAAMEHICDDMLYLRMKALYISNILIYITLLDKPLAAVCYPILLLLCISIYFRHNGERKVY